MTCINHYGVPEGGVTSLKNPGTVGPSVATNGSHWWHMLIMEEALCIREAGFGGTVLLLNFTVNLKLILKKLSIFLKTDLG